MPKCIIFDCDGTLVDGELIANQHCVNFYADHGYHIDPEASLRLFTGMTMEDVQAYIQETAGIHIPGEKWFQGEYRNKLYQDFEQNLQPLMVPLLQNLEKYSIAKCVASNSVPDRILKALDYSKQRSFFQDDHVFSAQQVAKPKPAPDLFLFACQHMGFDPKDCVVIEDTTVGIDAALGAGMAVIGFLGGAHAKSAWYQDKIKAYDIPVAYDSEELWGMLKKEQA